MNIKQLAIISAVSILFIYGILIVSAFYFFDVDTLSKTLSDERIFSAISISIGAASIATLLAILIAIPSAFALSRYSFWLKPAIDTILELPMIISPAALGALILIFFQNPIGSFLRENTIDIVFAFSGIVVAQFVTVLGISTRLMKAVFDEIPVRYENIARTMGATNAQTFLNIAMPLAKKGILSAVILTWAKAIGEFGATITVAGSMAFKTETLPTAIFMKLSTADIKGTVIIILILFTISMMMLILARIIMRKKKYD